METFAALLAIWSPVNSPHKGQWRGTLMFSLICVWINGWVNTREAGDLRHHRAHYDVIVMVSLLPRDSTLSNQHFILCNYVYKYYNIRQWNKVWRNYYIGLIIYNHAPHLLIPVNHDRYLSWCLLHFCPAYCVRFYYDIFCTYLKTMYSVKIRPFCKWDCEGEQSGMLIGHTWISIILLLIKYGGNYLYWDLLSAKRTYSTAVRELCAEFCSNWHLGESKTKYPQSFKNDRMKSFMKHTPVWLMILYCAFVNILNRQTSIDKCFRGLDNAGSQPSDLWRR